MGNVVFVSVGSRKDSVMLREKGKTKNSVMLRAREKVILGDRTAAATPGTIQNNETF